MFMFMTNLYVSLSTEHFCAQLAFCWLMLLWRGYKDGSNGIPFPCWFLDLFGHKLGARFNFKFKKLEVGIVGKSRAPGCHSYNLLHPPHHPQVASGSDSDQWASGVWTPSSLLVLWEEQTPNCLDPLNPPTSHILIVRRTAVIPAGLIICKG